MKRPPPPVVPCIYYSADGKMQIFTLIVFLLLYLEIRLNPAAASEHTFVPICSYQDF